MGVHVEITRLLAHGESARGDALGVREWRCCWRGIVGRRNGGQTGMHGVLSVECRRGSAGREMVGVVGV